MEREFYNRGLDKVLQGDLEGALQEFDHALQINPQFAEAYYRRGVVRFDLGNHSGAIEDYTLALQLNCENIESYFGRALARLAIAQPTKALEDVKHILNIKPNHAPAYSLQATAYRKLGDTQAAIASLKGAAQIYLEQKDTVNCRRCLDTISQLQATQRRAVMATEIENFLESAVNKVKQGQYQAALEDFNWLLQVDPQNAKTFCYRGMVHCKLGNYQGAIQDLAQAMQLNPQDAEVRNHRGLVRLELRDYRGAIEDFTQLLHSDPKNIEACINRGHAYHKQGNYRQAIEDYSRALTLQPNNAEVYCHRAVARSDFKDYQGAIDDYQNALNIYLDQHDWSSYQNVLGKLKIQESRIRSASQRGATSVNVDKIFSYQEKPVWSNTKSTRELQNRLLSLVGGYWEVAERLIELAKRKTPGMAENWYLEKVIYDLERDRFR